MDLKKFKIFNSGLSETDREEIAKNEAVQAKFKEQSDKVHTTMRTKGWKYIMDKMVVDQSITINKCAKCSKKELDRLQLEIKIRKEFLDKWSPYAS